MKNEPTPRQKEALVYIAECIREHHHPPSIREIGDHFGVNARSAFDYVVALREKGLVKHGAKRARTIELTEAAKEYVPEEWVVVPILGTVAAGRPILAEENLDGVVPIHTSFLKKGRRYFALRVRGDSMKDAGILDKDLALMQRQNTARNRDIVVAVVDDAVTLKRFFREPHRIRLQPENDAYNPIYSQDVRVLGKLAYVIRSC